MELILNSRGINTRTGMLQIKEALHYYELKDKKIFVVSFPENGLEKSILDNCITIGFSKENVLFSRDGIPGEEVSFIYVTEGNTFEMLDYMRKENLCDYVIDKCKAGAVYIGSSAGAIIAGTDIRTALEFDSNYMRMRDFTGLKLIDGAVLPHFTYEQTQSYLETTVYDFKNEYSVIYNVDNDHYLKLSGYLDT